MSDYPTGPFPADTEQSILAIIKEVGVGTLTMNVLRKRLAAKYKISFENHDAALSAALKKVMQTAEVQLELQKAQQAAAEGPAGGKGKKRGRSPSDKKSKKDDKKDKKSKKEKKEKKPEDYPKAALSAYFIFANDTREKIKKESPDLSITEVARKIGESWKVASEEAKARYQKLADADKKRHEKEMETYLARGGHVIKRGSKKASSGKAKKDPNAPKRALSAYMYFANDYRAKHPEVPMLEQMKQAGAAWGTLPEGQKKPYEELAAKDKVRYERERAAYSA